MTIKSGDSVLTVPETELSGQSDDEFIGLWVEYFNNGCCIDWQYRIGKMPTLTSQQAARLMCALDPDSFADLSNRPNKNDPGDLCNLARDIERLALATGMATASPEAWVTWGDSNKFKVHWQFRAAVERKQKDAPELAPQPDAAPAAPVVQATDWRELARNSAWEIIERDLKKNLYPSQTDIADEIAKKFCNSTPKIVGAAKKPLTGAYIKRHALKGVSSEQGRQLSTSCNRGK